MKLWKDMTPEEKGALLLAYHEGKVIEWCYGLTFRMSGSSDKRGMEPCWNPEYYYRVKPKPVVTEVVMIGGFDHRDSWGFGEGQLNPDTHKITFNLVDGEPDCDSIKMIKL